MDQKATKLFELDKLAGGALTERFAVEMDKVIKNIYDPNTEPDKKRKITITVTIEPSHDRQTAIMHINTKSVLQPMMPVQTPILLDKNLRTGQVSAAEITRELPGQIDISGNVNIPKTADLGTV